MFIWNSNKGMEDNYKEITSFFKDHYLLTLFLLIIIIVGYVPKFYELYQQPTINRLQSEINDKDKAISDLRGNIHDLEESLEEKNSEINRMESILAPYRTIAYELYKESDAEALKKLAEEIERLREADIESQKVINRLKESDIDKTSKINNLEKELDRVSSSYQKVEPYTVYMKELFHYDPEAEKCLEKGCELSDQGKHSEAMDEFLDAVKIYPEYDRAYYAVGNEQKVLGKNEDAIASYKKAIEINPFQADYYNNMGNTFSNIKKHDEAIKAFQKAIEVDNKYANAYNNLGNSYSEMGKYNEAISSYDKGIDVEPEMPQIYYNKAMTMMEMGKQPKEIIEVLKRFIEIQKDKSDKNIKKALDLINRLESVQVK